MEQEERDRIMFLTAIGVIDRFRAYIVGQQHAYTKVADELKRAIQEIEKRRKENGKEK